MASSRLPGASAGGFFGIGGAGLLVDQEEVAYEKGRFHRLGGDAEGLGTKRDDEDRDDDEVEERLERRKDTDFVMV